MSEYQSYPSKITEFFKPLELVMHETATEDKRTALKTEAKIEEAEKKAYRQAIEDVGDICAEAMLGAVNDGVKIGMAESEKKEMDAYEAGYEHCREDLTGHDSDAETVPVAKSERIRSGVVYMITSPSNPGKMYIGSTHMTKENRLAKHYSDKAKYEAGKHNYISSFEILDFGDAEIDVLEHFTGTDEELRIREQAHLDMHDCVNRQRAHQTPEQYVEQMKAHNKTLMEKRKTGKTREEYLAYQKAYREKNKDIIKAKREAKKAGYVTPKRTPEERLENSRALSRKGHAKRRKTEHVPSNPELPAMSPQEYDSGIGEAIVELERENKDLRRRLDAIPACKGECLPYCTDSCK